MEKTVYARVLNKVAYEADWLAVDPIIGRGEFALVIDSTLSVINFKAGTGILRFSELSYGLNYAANLVVQPTGTLLPSGLTPGKLALLQPNTTYTQAGGPNIVTAVNSFNVAFWNGTVWTLPIAITISVDLTNYSTKSETALKADETNGDGSVLRGALGYSTVTGGVNQADGYYRYDTGVFVTNSSYKARLYSVTGGKQYFINGQISGAVAALVVFFDASGNFINPSYYRGTSSTVTYTRASVQAPANAVSMGITTITAYGSVEIKVYPTIIKEIDDSGNKIARLSKSLFVTVSANDTRTDGFYRANNGTFTTLAPRNSSRYPIVQGRSYYATAKVTGAATALAVYYDSTGTFLSSELVGPSTGTTTYTDQLLTVPPTAATVAICSDGTNPVLKYGDYDAVALQGGTNKTIKQLDDAISALANKAFNKALGDIGDSITATETNRWVGFWRQFMSPSNVHNNAVGGARWSKSTRTLNGTTYTTQNYDDPNFAGIAGGDFTSTTDPVLLQQQLNNCMPVQAQKFIAEVTAGTFPTPEVFVFSAGTNDDQSIGTASAALATKTIDRDNTFNFANAIAYTVRLISAAYPNCALFGALPIQRGDVTAKNDLLKTTKNPILREIFNSYGIIVIDCFNESGISTNFEISAATRRDLNDDLLHPNSAGGLKHFKCIARSVIDYFTI